MWDRYCWTSQECMDAGQYGRVDLPRCARSTWRPIGLHLEDRAKGSWVWPLHWWKQITDPEEIARFVAKAEAEREHCIKSTYHSREYDISALGGWYHQWSKTLWSHAEVDLRQVEQICTRTGPSDACCKDSYVHDSPLITNTVLVLFSPTKMTSELLISKKLSIWSERFRSRWHRRHHSTVYVRGRRRHRWLLSNGGWWVIES